MLNHGVLALNDIKVGGHVPGVAQSRSELPRNDDIAGDVNNERSLFVQAWSPRWEWLTDLTYLQTANAERKCGADL